MGLGSFLYKQFVEVIQWTESGSGVLAYRFPTSGLEIKNKASLTVRESQIAMFINEGKAADIFNPGMYELTTQTLPILTYLQNWDKAFESPFKSDVYFFSTREQVNQLWGTATPITLRDKEFGIVRIRANGAYSYQIKDVDTFWKKLSSTTEEYRVEDIEGQLRATIMTSLASFLGSSEIAFIDMAANQSILSQKLKDAIAPALAEYGLELKTFMVQSVSLPEELEKHLDKVSSMGMIKDLNNYAKFEAADNIGTAAANEGGIAGIGTGMGAGFAMGQMMTDSFAGMSASTVKSSPIASEDPIALLEKLDGLLKKGILTQAEFDAKKVEILSQIK